MGVDRHESRRGTLAGRGTRRWAVWIVALSMGLIASRAEAAGSTGALPTIVKYVKAHARRVGFQKLRRSFPEGTLPALARDRARYQRATLGGHEALRLYLPVSKRTLLQDYRGPGFRGGLGQRGGEKVEIYLHYLLRAEPKNQTGLTWDLIGTVSRLPRGAKVVPPLARRLGR